MDVYLKFQDEAEFLEAAEAADMVREGKAVSTPACGLDVVGEIRTVTGYAGDPPVAQFSTVPGFHVNARGTLPEAFEPFVIAAPATPFRVWAN